MPRYPFHYADELMQLHACTGYLREVVFPPPPRWFTCATMHSLLILHRTVVFYMFADHGYS